MATYVDRPSVHRLLGLAHHIELLFIHVFNVRQLILESAHEPLKFFYRVNKDWTAMATQLIGYWWKTRYYEFGNYRSYKIVMLKQKSIDT